MQAGGGFFLSQPFCCSDMMRTCPPTVKAEAIRAFAIRLPHPGWHLAAFRMGGRMNFLAVFIIVMTMLKEPGDTRSPELLSRLRNRGCVARISRSGSIFPDQRPDAQ